MLPIEVASKFGGGAASVSVLGARSARGRKEKGNLPGDTGGSEETDKGDSGEKVCGLERFGQG